MVKLGYNLDTVIILFKKLGLLNQESLKKSTSNLKLELTVHQINSLTKYNYVVYCTYSMSNLKKTITTNEVTRLNQSRATS